MGESIDIVKQFKVKKVWLNSFELSSIEESLIKVLNELKIDYVFGKRGDVIQIAEYQFDFLNPKFNINENDNSLVIYTTINNHRILLMGDVSSKIERDLINEYSNLKVDILKLGHHGSISSTSESFLDVIKPKYGVIQVGLHNRFNHPSKVVINRLLDRKVKILQTSINGSIKIIFRANDVTIISVFT
jgi:competence protein ComEC